MKHRMVKAMVNSVGFFPEGTPWDLVVQYMRAEVTRFIWEGDAWCQRTEVSADDPQKEA